MPQTKTTESIEQTYNRLEKILLENNCKIISKKSPHHIQVNQGSLMGITPTSAKKTMTFSLNKQGSKTTISASSNISSDWKNLTIFGNILTAFVIALFLWIANDLNNYLKASEPGVWTWIAQIISSQNNQAINLIINLIHVLAIFLTLVILIEILIVLYVYPRKDCFSQKIVQKIYEALPNNKT